MKRWLKYSIALVVSLTISLSLSLYIQTRSRSSQKDLFTQISKIRAEELKNAVENSLSLLKSLEHYLTDDFNFDQHDFKKISASYLLNTSYVRALSFNAYLLNHQRDSFSSWNRLNNDQSFMIKQKNNEGKFVFRDSAEYYVVVQFIEPLAQNYQALGFDIASDNTRDLTIKAAISKKKLQITAPITLVQSEKLNNGILALNPIFKNEEVFGFTVGVFDLDALIDKSISKSNEYTLVCADVTNEPIEFYSNFPPGQEYDLNFNYQMNFFGRNWELRFYSNYENSDTTLNTIVLFLLMLSISTIFLIVDKNTETVKLHLWESEKLNNQNELLLKEVHHRVKNNLQVVNSLLALESNRLNDERVKSILQKTQSRINSMSYLHELLYQNDDFAEIYFRDYVQKLVTSLLSSMFNENIKISYLIDENIIMRLERCLSVGLIINELVTNSLKYAFIDQPNPEIVIEVKKVNDSLQFYYRDNGCGIKSNAKNGLGSLLIKRLIKQLKGREKKDDQNMTTGFRLKFITPIQ